MRTPPPLAAGAEWDLAKLHRSYPLGDLFYHGFLEQPLNGHAVLHIPCSGAASASWCLRSLRALGIPWFGATPGRPLLAFCFR